MKATRPPPPTPATSQADDHPPYRRPHEAYVEDRLLLIALEILVARPRPRWMRPDEDDSLAMPA